MVDSTFRSVMVSEMYLRQAHPGWTTDRITHEGFLTDVYSRHDGICIPSHAVTVMVADYEKWLRERGSSITVFGQPADRETRYVLTLPHPRALNGEIVSCDTTCILCRPSHDARYGQLTPEAIAALAEVSANTDFATAEKMMLFWARVADTLKNAESGG